MAIIVTRPLYTDATNEMKTLVLSPFSCVLHVALQNTFHNCPKCQMNNGPCSEGCPRATSGYPFSDHRLGNIPALE